MPEKSRRQRYSARSKRQGKMPQPAVAVTTPASDSAVGTVAPTRISPAQPKASPAFPSRGTIQMEKASAVRFANVPKEMRTIGILAGVILIGLIVLARVF